MRRKSSLAINFMAVVFVVEICLRGVSERCAQQSVLISARMQSQRPVHFLGCRAFHGFPGVRRCCAVNNGADKDKDGTLSSEEIDNAVVALKTVRLTKQNWQPVSLGCAMDAAVKVDAAKKAVAKRVDGHDVQLQKVKTRKNQRRMKLHRTKRIQAVINPQLGVSANGIQCGNTAFVFVFAGLILDFLKSLAEFAHDGAGRTPCLGRLRLDLIE